MPVFRRKNEEISEYEQLRQNNIKDNKAILEQLMKELKDQAPLPIIGTVTAKNSSRTKRLSNDGRRSLPLRLNPPRNGRCPRFNSSLTSPPVTRARARRGSLSSDGSSVASSSVAKGRFSISGIFGRGSSGDDDDSLDGFVEDENKPLRQPSRRSTADRENILMPEDITDNDLKMVADRSSYKTYDPAIGTTCHQCRQKTLDMKTVCRNKLCHGVRGYFCGPCLKNRYGEDAREALKDPKWICPPCRGICNCSICRNRSGKHATGILIHIAQEYGYSNVAEYLESLKNKS